LDTTLHSPKLFPLYFVEKKFQILLRSVFYVTKQFLVGRVRTKLRMQWCSRY